MKRIAYFLLALSICFGLYGCQAKENDYSDRHELYEFGLEVIHKMQMKADSEAYQQLMGTPASVTQLMGEFELLDMDDLSAVYHIEIPGTDEILKNIDPENMDAYNSLPLELKEDIDNRIVGAAANSFLSRFGVNYISCAAILSTTKNISSLRVKEVTYYLYYFDGGMTIMVTFNPSGVATAQIVTWFHEDFKVFPADLFEEMGFRLTQIDI